MTLFLIFIFGLCIGSFLNVVIDRSVLEQSLGGRSHCDHCRKTLFWRDLIPVISFFILRGKCRFCRKEISWFYPFVELITAVTYLFIWQWLAQKSIVDIMPILAYFTVISSLLVIFFADWKYHIIPDEMNLLIFITALLINPLEQVGYYIGAGLATMLMIYSLYFITRGRGMGFGDVKLAGVIGFLLGFQDGVIGLYLAFVLGGLFSLILIATKQKGLKSKIAFGPFLVAGTAIMLFFQEQIRAIGFFYIP